MCLRYIIVTTYMLHQGRHGGGRGQKWPDIGDVVYGWPYSPKPHCCMKCPQILREKTSSQKYTVIALRIQWKVSAEGITLN